MSPRNSAILLLGFFSAVGGLPSGCMRELGASLDEPGRTTREFVGDERAEEVAGRGSPTSASACYWQVMSNTPMLIVYGATSGSGRGQRSVKRLHVTVNPCGLHG